MSAVREGVLVTVPVIVFDIVEDAEREGVLVAVLVIVFDGVSVLEGVPVTGAVTDVEAD